MSEGSRVETRHQVFVSSTYLDLVEERRAVMQALLELDCIPAGMEMFPAASEDQWTLIREVIDMCDYYVVVVGGRYGSVTPEGISYTEMEYDYAVANDIPVLGFVHANPGSIPMNMSEISPEAREKLEGFRTKVMQRVVKEYRGPDELASVVSRSLIRTMKQHPRPGWVRGDEVMTDAVRAEIAELRASLAEADKRLTETESSQGSTIDTSFAHGDDEVELSFEIIHGPYRQNTQSVDLDFTWDEILDVLGPYMIDEAAEGQLRRILGEQAIRQLVEEPNGNWDTAIEPSAVITNDSWGKVVVQLRALGAIASGTKRRTVRDTAVYWSLTPAGDEYIVRLKATKRSAADA